VSEQTKPVKGIGCLFPLCVPPRSLT
jgi:hypothetical protein